MRRGSNQKGLVFLLACLLAISLAGNVFGAGTLTEIDAFLNSGINVVVNGKTFEAYDTDGTKYVPITYKGRTYLPMRAVAEAVGLKVTWDPNTETAYLGDVAGQVDPNQIRWVPLSGEITSNPDKYRIKSRHAAELTLPNGVAFEQGYVTDGSAGISLWFTPDFQFSKLRGKLYFDAEESLPFPPKISMTDENEMLIKEFTGKWGEVLDFEVDIKDVQELWFWADGDKSVLGNPELGK